MSCRDFSYDWVPQDAIQFSLKGPKTASQRARDAKIKSFGRQNDVATSFCDVMMTLSLRRMTTGIVIVEHAAGHHY